MKDFNYRKKITPDNLKEQHYNTLHERIIECEKRIEGLYDIIEELLKKLD